jgi:hypothetical protein
MPWWAWLLIAWACADAAFLIVWPRIVYSETPDEW